MIGLEKKIDDTSFKYSDVKRELEGLMKIKTNMGSRLSVNKGVV